MNITVGQTIRIKDSITGKTVKGQVLEVIGGEYGRFVLLVNEVEQWDCHSENCTIMPTPGEMRKINTFIEKSIKADELMLEVERLDSWMTRHEEGIDKSEYEGMKRDLAKLENEVQQRREQLTPCMESWIETETSFSIEWGCYC